jgi:hypothetical protein
MAALVFAGLILAGIVLHQVPEHLLWSWLYSVSRTLADALVVAGILGFTVDSFLKRALIRDVGAIFIGWSLPQEVRNYIRKVSQTSIVRKNHRAHFRFVLNEAKNEATVKMTSSMEVFNFSTGVRVYRPKLSLDLRDKPDESAVRCEIRRGAKVRSKDAAALNKPGCVEKGPDVITWAFGGMLLFPQDVSSLELRPACTVRWECQATLRVPHTDLLSFTWPTIGVEVTADCPPELEFSCDSDDQDSMMHAPGSNQWTYNRLYMPGQSVRPRWRLRNESSQRQDTPPVPEGQSSAEEPIDSQIG